MEWNNHERVCWMEQRRRVLCRTVMMMMMVLLVSPAVNAFFLPKPSVDLSTRPKQTNVRMTRKNSMNEHNNNNNSSDDMDMDMGVPVSRRKSASTTKYLRMVPRGGNNNRSRRRVFELQTAVTTFQHPQKNVQLELHSQIHLANDAYYHHYNTPQFSNQFDQVLYELVVSQQLLTTDGRIISTTTSNNNDQTTTTSPIMASLQDTQMANQYGLSCQANCIHYHQPNWKHADTTKEQFMDLLQKQQQQQQQQKSSFPFHKQSSDLPLWALASSSPLFPGVEFISALFRPFSPSMPLTARVTRRLFSNLFLPGDALAGVLRAIFWTGIPAPELSVLLLDWSSVTPRPTGGISPIALPVLEALLTGNLLEARQLIFSQILINGQASSTSSTNTADNQSLLIHKRNQQALHVLQTCISQNNNNNNNNNNNKHQKYALLYGGMHCPDLHRRLEAMGFQHTQTSWRTAWSISLPTFGFDIANNNNNKNSNNNMAAGLVVLPLYLTIGALDWVDTIQGISTSLSHSQPIDATAIYIFYLLRHVTLYLGLGKFLVEWDGTNLFPSNTN